MLEFKRFHFNESRHWTVNRIDGGTKFIKKKKEKKKLMSSFEKHQIRQKTKRFSSKDFRTRKEKNVFIKVTCCRDLKSEFS